MNLPPLSSGDLQTVFTVEGAAAGALVTYATGNVAAGAAVEQGIANIPNAPQSQIVVPPNLKNPPKSSNSGTNGQSSKPTAPQTPLGLQNATQNYKNAQQNYLNAVESNDSPGQIAFEKQQMEQAGKQMQNVKSAYQNYTNARQNYLNAVKNNDSPGQIASAYQKMEQAGQQMQNVIHPQNQQNGQTLGTTQAATSTGSIQTDTAVQTAPVGGGSSGGPPSGSSGNSSSTQTASAGGAGNQSNATSGSSGNSGSATGTRHSTGSGQKPIGTLLSNLANLASSGPQGQGSTGGSSGGSPAGGSSDGSPAGGSSDNSPAGDSDPVPSPMPSQLNAAQEWGMKVTEITPNGAAAKADLRVGDTIVSAAGKRIQSFEDLTAVLASANGSIEIAILNGENNKLEKMNIVPVSGKIGILTEPVVVE